ncbi:MAG: putative ABC-type ATPase [Cognaticolwellia sp.]|jgi:predicted ABC-type ATPase
MVLGPNGAGKSTYYRHQIQPRLKAEFVNADDIQRLSAPNSGVTGSYAAAEQARQRRHILLETGASFVTETVASHPSKLDLLSRAQGLGFEVWVSFIFLKSADLAVARVARRVSKGGHPVPEHKVRTRYERLLPIAKRAIQIADRGMVLDNSDSDQPLKSVLTYSQGMQVWRTSVLDPCLESLFST